MKLPQLSAGSVSFSEERYMAQVMTLQTCRKLEGEKVNQWSLQFYRCTLFINSAISGEQEINSSYRKFQIHLIGNHILVLVGSVLNVVTLLIMRKIIFIKKVRLCLTLLAVTDILHILLGPGVSVLCTWLMYNVVETHQLLNEFYIYSDRIVKQFQVWIIQYLLVSRCQAILATSHASNTAGEMCRVQKMTWSLVLMLLILNSPVLWLPKLSSCEIPKLLYLSVRFETISKWINFLLAMCIPCSVILASNMAIIIKIIYTHYVNHKVGLERRNSHKSMTVTKNSFILICSSLFYVACTIPEALLEMFPATSFLADNLLLETKIECFVLLYYLNNILHVFIYCLSSAEFRHKLCVTCQWFNKPN